MKALCSGKQRARNETDKQQREQQILAAAADLFATRRYEAVTLADVAALTGVTKAALYRYFRSKEVLYLAVYRRELTTLTDAVQQCPASQLTDQFAVILLKHPLFCSLTAILHIALETGLTEQEAYEFKLFLLQQTQRAGTALQLATGQSAARCFEFLMLCQQALIGCWHQGNPPETARLAMQREPLGVFRLDYATLLKRHIGILVDALLTA